MPLAGRLADLWGARRLFLGALVVFIVGSALAGPRQNLDQLIAARLVQAVGGGVLVPVGTAAASHLFEGHDRPRALGVIGALTFLGMAAGPVRRGGDPRRGPHPTARSRAAGGSTAARSATLLAPAWRWVFYVNVPIGHRRARSSPGPRRRAGRRRDGPGGVDVARRGRLRPRAGRRAGRGRRCSAAARSPDGPDPIVVSGARSRSPRSSRTLVTVVRGLRAPGPVPRPAPLPERDVQLGRARLAADRLRVRDGDHRRRRLRRSRAVRRPGRAAARPRGARRGDRARGARVRLRGPRRCRCGS